MVHDFMSNKHMSQQILWDDYTYRDHFDYLFTCITGNIPGDILDSSWCLLVHPHNNTHTNSAEISVFFYIKFNVILLY